MIEVLLTQIGSLLEYDDLESIGRKLLCYDPARGACSDDDEVHRRLSFKLGLLTVHDRINGTELIAVAVSLSSSVSESVCTRDRSNRTEL